MNAPSRMPGTHGNCLEPIPTTPSAGTGAPADILSFLRRNTMRWGVIFLRYVVSRWPDRLESPIA